jgi:hypothetical protein
MGSVISCLCMYMLTNKHGKCKLLFVYESADKNMGSVISCLCMYMLTTTSHVLSAYTYTNRRLHFPCFCQHIHTQTRDYTSHVFVSIYIHKQEITLPIFLSTYTLHKQEITLYADKNMGSVISCLCMYMLTKTWEV